MHYIKYKQEMWPNQFTPDHLIRGHKTQFQSIKGHKSLYETNKLPNVPAQYNTKH